MSRRKNRRLRIAANAIRKGSGQGGIARQLGGRPMASVSKHDQKKNQNILRISREVLENLDGALLGKDIKKRTDAMFTVSGQAKALASGEADKPVLTNPFTENFDLYNEVKADSSGAVADDFQCSDFAPKINVDVKKIPRSGDEKERTAITGVTPLGVTSKDSSLCVLSAKHFEFSPTNALTSEIEVFANAIPTHEMSRCVPFLDVTFFTPVDATRDGKPLSLSLAKALVGDNEIKREQGTKRLAQSYQGGKGTQFGMELFTLPQTVTPLNRKGRPVPVLDPFRPLMSITGFDVTVVPAAGLMEKKKAKLSITLHDRSRLHEIAEFVRPQNYRGVELLIEYGWSHPDSSGRNSYGDFLNAMRKKEKYRLYNSSFSLQNNGEVSITLDLIALGVIHTEDTSIFNNNSMKPISQAIGNIRAKVQSQLKKLSKGKVRKDIKPLIAIDEGLLSNSTVYAADNPIFNNEISEKSLQLAGFEGITGGDAKTLINNLKKLQEQRNQFNSQKKILIDGVVDVLFSKTDDPFFPAVPEKFGGAAVRKTLDLTEKQAADRSVAFSSGLLATLDNNTARVARSGLPGNGTEYITLGKLFSFFVGRPLAATNNFAEVQMFFYNFSSESGFQGKAVDIPLSTFTIDQFLIKKEEFSQALDRMIRNLGTTEIPIETFMNYIIKTFVVYPFAPLTMPNSVDNEAIQATLVKDGARSSIASDAPESVREAYKAATDGFRPPKIQIMFDAIPLDSAYTQSKSSANQSTVLRVHVFDNHTGRHAALVNGLKAASDTLDTIKLANKGLAPAIQSQIAGNTSQQDLKRSTQDFLNDVKNAFGDALKRIDTANGPRFKIEMPFEKLKKIIKRGYPSLTYGADGSVITSARFSSLQSSGYKNTMMKRAGRSPEMTAKGTQPNGLPLQIQPADASITMLGCPILRYAQHFFVDFGTGTSMDDLYFVKTINHKIAPGNFTTSLTLANRDGDAAFQSMFNLLDRSVGL
ncbi:MAG: hypothetical protein VXZ72_05075, partial [Chlamydiota bacterium]|nr:hypothetical protein [Chlamydiota bacterium]